MEKAGIRTVSQKLVVIQSCLGFFAHLAIGLPFCNAVTGLDGLDPKKRYVFVSNHVSLLDTILLGGIFWRAGHYPLLVLGDRKVWHSSAIKRALSKNIGFLLERGKLNPARLEELQSFGRSSRHFNLLVFPEGTRGNGIDVAECQAGIFHIAQVAQAPIVPIFIENMQLLSTKTGSVHPISGLRKVSVHFGTPIEPDTYLPASKEEFTELIRTKISAARSPKLEQAVVAARKDLTAPQPNEIDSGMDNYAGGTKTPLHTPSHP